MLFVEAGEEGGAEATMMDSFDDVKAEARVLAVEKVAWEVEKPSSLSSFGERDDVAVVGTSGGSRSSFRGVMGVEVSC